MNKKQLMALKQPYPSRKINSQWPVSEVAVEASRVSITCQDKLKREIDMAPFPNDYEVANAEALDTEEVAIKRVRKP